MIRRAVPRALLTGSLVPLLAAVLVGCGMSTPAAAPGPVPSVRAVAVPPGGVRLADLGVQHGPAVALTLPADVRIGLRIDQPNMVTMTFLAPAGVAIGDWLRTHLAAGGFRVTAAGSDGLVFEGYAWSGAFTVSAESSALTLRRSPSGG